MLADPRLEPIAFRKLSGEIASKLYRTMGGPKGRTPMRGKLREYSAQFLQNVRILLALQKLVIRGPYDPPYDQFFAPRRHPHVLERYRNFPNNAPFGPDIHLIPTASFRKFTRLRPRFGQNSYSVNFAEKRHFDRPYIRTGCFPEMKRRNYR